jgi:hypothetical protein
MTKSPSTEDLHSLDIVPVSGSARSKAGKKAKRKGSTFERALCKSFSNFWGSKFFRTPMSGGSQLKHDYNLAGDISTPDEDFPYHVEAKNQQALKGFYTIFTSSKCPVWKWWGQCTTECPKDKVPLLVFTKNYMPPFVCVPYLYGNLLEGISADLGKGDIHNMSNEFIRVRGCIMMTLKRFLTFNKDIHLRSSKEYLKWGNRYDVSTSFSPSTVKTVLCKTSK